ncbi:hypothetical protein DT594_16795 [Halopseudomonas laoshanensis]|uniref:Transcriptional regulator n=1 Tax=Halopseudomonas laoshanensis TaxID=2268758 RepID=A0A7V7GQF0_9GAMM|nr:hypothetical protein [Halopseudomonas laoshanensis]KAA0691885.1 hypothetical protein DT594_16795 [Halopseudomonas laoshanensis]MBQ0743676.1 hypothetical protein [Pseudomonas sp.]MBQ0776476.1 hypothetical protein [Pseudomonas sp.]
MKDSKPSKQAAKVTTPLHLLQTLTRTLNEHLGEACQQAEKDARKALEKLNRQHEKLLEKIAEAEEKLGSRQANGNDAKSLEKSQTKLSALQQALSELQTSRAAAEDYTRQLQNDIQQTLRIGKGLERIEGQAAQAIEKRGKPPAPARVRNRKPGNNARRKKPATADTASASS